MTRFRASRGLLGEGELLPQGPMCPQTLGSIQEIQELLTLGRCLVSLWCFLGAVRCQGLGTRGASSCPHLYYLWFSPHSVIFEHGVRGCRLSDAIRIIAHFTPCHLSDRTHTASDSPTGSFSTWHLEGTLGDVRRQSWSHAGCGQESPGPQGSWGPEQAWGLWSI